MFNHDPHSGSVTWNSGHGTMAVTPEDDPVDSNEKLVGVVGGIDENVSAGNLSDVEWKEDDPLFEFNDENVTIPQTPDAALIPVQTSTENKTGSSLESPLEKKSCFPELIAVHLSKATFPLHLESDYSHAELVGYTWPLLVNVIPWIKYEAQNMVEPTFRQEAPVHKRSQSSSVHHSHDSVVLLMEAGTRMVAITPSLRLPSGSPSYSHYQNLSGVCHFIKSK